MPGIWNVNKAYDMSNTQKVSGKLSFSVGEVFAARLVKGGEKNMELLLKLLDGWQFSAKLEKPIDFVPKGLMKFEVTGFEQGTLIIKPVAVKEEKNEQELSSIDNALEEQNINVDKSDYDLLQKMVKHNMPLTKENISKVKTFVDFKEKMNSNPEEEDQFISKYLNSKGIEAESDKGKEIVNNLKGFFKELKNISDEDLLTLIENGIDINEDNIKSFNKIVKESGTIYKDSQEIHEELNKDSGLETVIAENNDNEIASSSESYVPKAQLLSEEKADSKNINELKAVINKESNSVNNSDDKMDSRQYIKEPISEDIESTNIGVKNTENSNNYKEGNFSVSPKDIEESSDNTLQMNNNHISNNKQPAAKNHILPNDREMVKLVKEEISNRTGEVKEVLKNLLEDKLNLKPEAYNKVMEGIKENINDFKVFNSLSNEYYYLDMPLKVKDNEYDCKLMIKDERGKGKKLDSKNVKVVVSVNTGNMGMIDSYIKVANNIMNIDIKCEEPWVKILDAGKEKVLKDISNTGYSVSVNVSKRAEDANIVNCRGFFEDNNIHSINTKV